MSTIYLQYICLLLYHCGVIFFEYHIRQRFSHFGVDGVGNVFKFIIGGFAARHRYEKLFFAFDNLDVVYHKRVVKGNRYHRFHFGIVCHLSYSDVCYFHKFKSFQEDLVLMFSGIICKNRKNIQFK